MLKAALEQGLLGEQAPLAGFVDVSGVRDSVRSLKSAFPDCFFHTFAAKANSLGRVLELLRDEGMGCEVASPGELALALRAGFAPASIVFDSPAKTRPEIEDALMRGIALNIDNFQELERVRAYLDNRGSDSVVGIRVNPQVGVGTIAAMSTATRTSKFGIALEDEGNRARVLEAYSRNRWLTCLHVHVGSQGCPLELIALGVKKAVELTDEINQTLGREQVAVIDIGGGLPVNFESDTVRPTFAHYARVLEEHAGALFSGRFKVITEFGRSLMAKNGFMAARVEYTKHTGGRQIAITHAGAQVATRTVFMPEMWTIRVSACDREGAPKRGEPVVQDVAGPCCFAGDIIAHQRRLPLLEPGDYVIAHDTGAYYFSTHFYYNSLPAPAVHGYTVGERGEVRFDRLKPAQSIDEVLRLVT